MNRKFFKYSIAAAILISLAIFIRMTDLGDVVLQIRKVNYGFIWVFLASFFAYLSGCLSWKFCFTNSSHISVHRLFYTRTVGELIALFNPTNIIAGEASKYYLLKDVLLTKEEKLDSILLSRVVLISSQIVIAIICCFWLSYYYTNTIILLCGFLIICLFLFLIVGLINGRYVLKLFGRSRFRFIRMIYIKLRDIQLRIKNFIYQNRTKLALSFQFASLHWFFGACEIYIILYYLGLDPLMMHCIIVDTGVVMLKSVAGFIPGQIGVEELSNKWLLSLIGIQGAGIWLTVSLLRRAKQLIWICISGLLYIADQYLVKSKKQRNGNIICDT